jgi:type VI secretion system protein ImpA
VSDVDFSSSLEDAGTPAVSPTEPPSSELTASETVDGNGNVPLLHSAPESDIETAEQIAAVDAAIAGICIPLPGRDPCGPDLDLDGDADYLNFFAQAEGLLPSSFFSSEDGRPFDRASVDLPRVVDAIQPFWDRSRDLRLLVLRARLLILDRNLGGFAESIAAIAYWLDKFWNDVHPRGDDDDLAARVAALAALDLPTVVFPLQYAPLCEARRIGAITYRAQMIATGEVNPRANELRHPLAALTEAIADAPPEVLATTRGHVAMLKASLSRIRDIFISQGSPIGLENLITLVDKLQAFIDPRAALDDATAASADDDDVSGAETQAGAATAASPTSLAEAQQALAAIGDYYGRSEPSSPTLPLVRQAHQLIGKSFFEVMSILVPNQMENAAFQIGTDQYFRLPVGKLSKLSDGAPSSSTAEADSPATSGGGESPYYVGSRAQAIALLDQVQRFFRRAEPSSPVPMLCDRARAFAERDFMGVLREVLPKSALKTVGSEN